MILYTSSKNTHPQLAHKINFNFLGIFFNSAFNLPLNIFITSHDYVITALIYVYGNMRNGVHNKYIVHENL